MKNFKYLLATFTVAASLCACSTGEYVVDLKTPITAIKGYVEGIMDGVADTPEKMERYIKTIYNKANEMDLLINELTLYSKIDSNRIPYNFNTIFVNDYFDDCAEDLKIELESRGIKFTYANYVGAEVKIIADSEQLKRVVNNIVSNSAKYMDKIEKKVHLRVKDVGDFVQIETSRSFTNLLKFFNSCSVFKSKPKTSGAVRIISGS